MLTNGKLVAGLQLPDAHPLLDDRAGLNWSFKALVAKLSATGGRLLGRSMACTVVRSPCHEESV